MRRVTPQDGEDPGPRSVQECPWPAVIQKPGSLPKPLPPCRGHGTDRHFPFCARSPDLCHFPLKSTLVGPSWFLNSHCIPIRAPLFQAKYQFLTLHQLLTSGYSPAPGALSDTGSGLAREEHRAGIHNVSETLQEWENLQQKPQSWKAGSPEGPSLHRHPGKKQAILRINFVRILEKSQEKTDLEHY